ncbi:MAG: NAD-dependent epimerase/dehydratase family protein, partial [Jiangellaceae bacterium]
MRVALAGAAGRIGRVVRTGLAARGHEVLALDVAGADGVVSVDVGDTAALSPLLAGYDAVVHLASSAGETSFEIALDTHLRVTYSVLEAMRSARVPRLVYASSNHAVGFSPRADRVTVDTRPRPDTFYGVGKAACEALCSLYVDRYRFQIACLRIGSFEEIPQTRRHLSTWLSPGDAVRLVEACLTVPALTYAVVYGISANTRGWWDLGPGRALGYHPEDDADVYADQI